MWKGVSHGIGYLKETLVTVCVERAKGRDSGVAVLEKKRNSLHGRGAMKRLLRRGARTACLERRKAPLF